MLEVNDMYFSWSYGLSANKPATLANGQFYQATDTAAIYFGTPSGEQRINLGMGAVSKMLIMTFTYPSTFTVDVNLGYSLPVSVSLNGTDIDVSFTNYELSDTAMVSCSQSVPFTKVSGSLLELQTSMLGDYGTMRVEIYER